MMALWGAIGRGVAAGVVAAEGGVVAGQSVLLRRRLGLPEGSGGGTMGTQGVMRRFGWRPECGRPLR